MVLPKDLILDVCEPYVTTETVRKDAKKSIRICVFGSFEFGDCDRRFIYGTEDSLYNSIFRDDSKIAFPLSFAEVSYSSKGQCSMVLKPISSFTNTDLEIIEDSIRYTLESRRVCSHYSMSRC